MTLIWLVIWFIAGHDALSLDPLNAWTATRVGAVVSFDRTIDRVTTVERIEP